MAWLFMKDDWALGKSFTVIICSRSPIVRRARTRSVIPSGRRGFGRWDLWWDHHDHTLILSGLTGRSLTLPPPSR